MNKGLGRIESHDERDKNFLMRSLLAPEAPAVQHKYWWSNGWYGDQGSTPQCVSFAWHHWLKDGPITQKLLVPDTAGFYRMCQDNDEWPGNAYDGTSVRAGAKVGQLKGLIESYYWAWDLNTLIDAVLRLGPVVVGTNWYYNMFYPNDKNRIVIGGNIAGGHAYKIDGVHIPREEFRIKNSWGKTWGRNGFATISFKDMERLIKEDGEACIAFEKKATS